MWAQGVDAAGRFRERGWRRPPHPPPVGGCPSRPARAPEVRQVPSLPSPACGASRRHRAGRAGWGLGRGTMSIAEPLPPPQFLGRGPGGGVPRAAPPAPGVRISKGSRLGRKALMRRGVSGGGGSGAHPRWPSRAAMRATGAAPQARTEALRAPPAPTPLSGASGGSQSPGQHLARRWWRHCIDGRTKRALPNAGLPDDRGHRGRARTATRRAIATIAVAAISSLPAR
jgi:hypothetical protein